jgi:hypothetical protein
MSLRLLNTLTGRVKVYLTPRKPDLADVPRRLQGKRQPMPGKKPRPASRGKRSLGLIGQKPAILPESWDL